MAASPGAEPIHPRNNFGATLPTPIIGLPHAVTWAGPSRAPCLPCWAPLGSKWRSWTSFGPPWLACWAPFGPAKPCCLACWALFGPAKPCCLVCWALFGSAKPCCLACWVPFGPAKLCCQAYWVNPRVEPLRGRPEMAGPLRPVRPRCRLRLLLRYLVEVIVLVLVLLCLLSP